MTPEAQRIAIAEACGWRMGTETVEHIDGYQWTETRKFWTSPTRKTYSLPDYLNDLNAMHEAEELFYAKADTLEGAERMRGYSTWLCHLAKYPLRATASQRAEAFLRTIGKWQDTAPREAKP